MHPPEIFISYAWKEREKSDEDSREHIVNQICDAFEKKGYTITRDKTHLPYKGDIEQFMKRIGAGKYVVAVVSEKYLKSDYCMFEAKEMLKHEDFEERVFPIVLDDAGVFGDKKFEYGIHWNERKTWVSEKIDQIGRDSSSAEWLIHERSIHDIAERVAQFITTIARLNLLSPQMHFERNFSDLVDTIDQKIKAGNGAATPSPRSESGASSLVSQTSPLPPPDLSGLDLSHALRPEFTESVLRTMLIRRQSVNLIGKRGTGRRRLLDDMRKCPLSGVKMVVANMRNFVSSYEGFLEDVGSSLGVKPDSMRFSDLMERAIEEKPQYIVLCLDHFEAISDGAEKLDSRSRFDFLNQINALRNTTYASLLCVTYEPHSQLKFDGVISWLDLKKMHLGSLSERQIGVELDRYRNLPDDLRTYLVQQVETEPEPIFLLDGLHSLLPGIELRLEKIKEMVKSLKRNK